MPRGICFAYIDDSAREKFLHCLKIYSDSVPAASHRTILRSPLTVETRMVLTPFPYFPSAWFPLLLKVSAWSKKVPHSPLVESKSSEYPSVSGSLKSTFPLVVDTSKSPVGFSRKIRISPDTLSAVPCPYPPSIIHAN